MIAVDIEQGSQEWLLARVGIPTASKFDSIITTKGEPSKEFQKYLYQLAGERVTGIPSESFSNGWTERGSKFEDEARNHYSLFRDVEIQQVGICYLNEDKKIGCSPDGLIGEDGGLELKCPAIHTHVEYLIQNKVPTKYFTQVQGNLYVTGRKWWDFVSFYPGIKPLVIRCERDEAFIAKLDAALRDFCKQLEELVLKIQ